MIVSPSLKGNLLLNSLPDKSQGREGGSLDKVNHPNNITSFSFWDQYGNPVAIRFIKFLPDRVKFHLNNSISFLAEDFDKKDNLEFQFYGYPPYKCPGHPADKKAADKIHTIILYEETCPGYFKDLVLTAKRKKVIGPDSDFLMKKTE